MKDFTKLARSIIAIGKNYSDHAKELGGTVPKVPMIFLKPTSSFLKPPGNIEKPCGINLHHEVELAVVVGKKGRDILEKDAYSYVAGYALALDMTARDIQEISKKKGHPWTVAKGFDTFTPIGDFIPKSSIPNPHDIHLWCKVDGQLKQSGNTKEMVFNIPTLLAHISSIMTLQPGDTILTGTPAGVGSVSAGQTITCGMMMKPSGKGGQPQLLSELELNVIDRPLLNGLTKKQWV